jgi:RNA polymerase sigma-70 factor (ECF subfamily)
MQLFPIRIKGYGSLKLMKPMLYSAELLTGIEVVSMEQDIDPLLALLKRIGSEDEAAMATLYDATVNRIFGLAIKIVLKPELAEEVVGDVFMQVWNKAKDFDSDRAVPLAWMLMICRSRSLDKLRREKKVTKRQVQEIGHKQTEDIDALTSFEYLDGIANSSRVYEALQVLNDKQRQLITLAFYKDMSHQEISEYTGEPLGTVKSNIRRAQLILRETLSREDFASGEVYGEA